MDFYQTNSTTYAWKYHLTEWFYELTYSSYVGSTGQNFLHRPNLPWIPWPEISNQGNSFYLFFFFEKGQKAIKEIRIQSNQGILLSHSVFERHIYDPSLQSYRLIECNTVSHLISFITLNRNFCSMIYVSLITIFQVFDSYLFIFSS